MYRVEYLITVDQKELFCKSEVSFNNLIQTIEGVSILKNQLKVGKLTAIYELQIGEIERGKQLYLHVKLSIDKNEHLTEFENFLRNFRGVLSRVNGKPPQILWDGVSFNYAQMAYPIVYEIENTMRKLITKFMLINVGLGWVKETIPREVSDSVRAKDAKLEQNYLFEVDFIQLSNFLFKEYSTVSPTAHIDIIKKLTDSSQLDLAELKKVIPQSNWDRYFSAIVKCDSEYLRVRWERLYEKRNHVAHNRPVSKTDYEDICILRDDVLPKLQQAIENLDKVAVLDDDREIVSEIAATSISILHSDFILAMNDLHEAMSVLVSYLPLDEADRISLSHSKGDVFYLLNLITQFDEYSLKHHKDIGILFGMRNAMVHQPNVHFSSSVLTRHWEMVVRHIVHIHSITEKYREGKKD